MSASGVPLLDDPAATRRQLETFLREYVEKAGADGVVLGLSGGIDSAVCAALAAGALGPERVHGFLLPHRDSNPQDDTHGRLVAQAFGIRADRIDVTPVVEAVSASAVTPVEGAAFANLKARARMITLYAHANAGNRLVVGTGNKSELLTGYFTKYGDGAADVYPIADLYKSQVRELARVLDVPAEIVAKPPSAGLWAGQTDEDELGVKYEDLDRVLQAFELGRSPDEAAEATGVARETVREIEVRILRSEHKRASLVVPKIGFRTPGLDWRMPHPPASASAGGGR